MFRRSLTIAAVCGVLLGVAGLPLPASAAARVAVKIDQVNPSTPNEKSDITISGQVTSTRTTGPLRVQLWASGYAIQNREDLNGHIKGLRELEYIGRPIDLPAGRGGAWTFQVNAEQLGISQTDVYPIEVAVCAKEIVTCDKTQQLASSRTFLPFHDSTDKTKRTKISWMVPLIDGPHRSGDRTFLDAKTLLERLAPQGRLGAMVATRKKSATWIVDPALLDDVQALAKSGNGTATAWLDKVRKATENAHVAITPYADPDVAALAHTGHDRYIEAARSKGETIAEAILGRQVDTDLAWPADGAADLDTLEALSVEGVTQAVLDDRTVGPNSPRVTWVDTADGKMKAYLVDAGLTASLSGQGGAALSRQRFLAETALLPRERPGQTMLIAPPRDVTPSVLDSLIRMKVPWLKNVALSGAEAKKRQGTVTYTGSQAELSRKYMGKVGKQMAKAEASYAVTGSQDRRPFDLALLRTTASVWRQDHREAGRTRMYKGVNAEIDKYIDSVDIVSTEEVTAGTVGKIPISVANDLNQPVSVQLKVEADNPDHLRIGKYEQLMRIDPGRSDTVAIPVNATRIGESKIKIRLYTPDGRPFGPAKDVTLQVSGYTTVALIIIAGALGVMAFAIGARVMRRRRPAGPPNAEVEERTGREAAVK